MLLLKLLLSAKSESAFITKQSLQWTVTQIKSGPLYCKLNHFLNLS